MKRLRFALYFLSLIVGLASYQSIFGFKDNVLALPVFVHRARTSHIVSQSKVTAQSAQPAENSLASGNNGKVLGSSSSIIQSTAAAGSPDISQLVTNAVNALVAQGKLKGDKGDAGPPGPAGAMSTLQPVQSIQPSVPGPIPSVFIPGGVVQPNPIQNFNGATLLSATDLSSQRFTTNDATVSNNLNVKGATTLSGNVNITGTCTGCGTPGGSDTQVQFNDGGVFGGNTAFTFDKTTGIASVNGSANNLTLQGSATGLLPAISTTGTDADVGINFIAKGAGDYVFGNAQAPLYQGFFGGNSDNIVGIDRGLVSMVPSTIGLANLTLMTSEGTSAAPLPVTNGRQIGAIFFEGAVSSSDASGPAIYATAEENFAPGHAGSRLEFYIVPIGSVVHP